MTDRLAVALIKMADKRITYLDKARQIKKYLHEAGEILPRLANAWGAGKRDIFYNALNTIVKDDLFEEIEQNWDNPEVSYEEFFNEVGKMGNFRQYLVEHEFYEMAIESALNAGLNSEAEASTEEFYHKYPADALIYIHHKLDDAHNNNYTHNYTRTHHMGFVTYLNNDFVNCLNNRTMNIEELIDVYQRRPEIIEDFYGNIDYSSLDNFGEFYLAVLESEGEKREKAMDAIVNQFYEQAIDSEDEELLHVALGIAVDGGERYSEQARELEEKLNPNCDPQIQKYTEALDLIDYLKEKVAHTFKINLLQKARVVKPSGSYGAISYDKYSGGKSDGNQPNA